MVKRAFSTPRIVGTLALALVLLLMAASPAPLVWLREQGLDLWQRLAPRERVSGPVTIVTIDEESLAARGLWPWPRDVTAQLIEAIARHEPAVIGVDILFPEPERGDQAGDARLKTALAGSRSVLPVSGEPFRDRRYPLPPRSAPFRVNTAEELPLKSFAGHTQSIPELSAAASGQGSITADVSSSGVIRRAIMVSRIGDLLAPSLSAEMVRVAMGVPDFALTRRGSGLLDLSIGSVLVPLQADGTLWIHYTPSDPQRFVSAESVMSGKVDPELLKGKMVLVGFGATGNLDVQYTANGETVPGAEIHAQILEQIFDNSLLIRPAWSRWAELLWLLCAGGLVVWLVPRVGALPASALGVMGVAAPLAASYGLFRGGWVLDGAVPSLGFVGVLSLSFAATYFERERQTRELREAQARMAGELEAAQRIQMGLLPDASAALTGDERAQVCALLEPARTVGGDFYDCFRLDESRVFFVVADVSGKGMPAALFMALSKAILKSNALREAPGQGFDLGTIVSRANAEISRENPESLFVTAFIGVLDLRDGSLQFCNAGHEPPVVRQAGGELKRFDVAEGPPLCVLRDFQYPTARYTMQAGECLCVVTDGVTEALDEQERLYGAQRLLEILGGAHGDNGAEPLAQRLRRDVAAFVGEADASDDLTLMCLQWMPGEARTINAR